jgi:hypothetical protein
MTQLGWTRRAFLARSGATAGILALGAVGCSSDDDDEAADDDREEDESSQAVTSGDGMVNDANVPETAAMVAWINEVYDHGVRRPGYEADIWAEGWIRDQFTEIGLENVRLEPVPLKKWEPTDWSLEVTPEGGETRTIECFPVPYSTPTESIELDLAAFDANNAAAVEGKASLYDVELLRLPADFLVGQGDAAELDPATRIVDPDGSLAGATHIVPFAGDIMDVMEKSIDGGATAFIGTLKNYPGNSFNYFVPYDAKVRPIPGVWISGTDGALLHEQLAAGPVKVKLVVTSTLEDDESHNVVGELPGADDEVVMIGSHHDGPWSSAVEDGSGIALVLAQATYWAAQPVEERPHRLVFLLHGGHMHDGAGLHKYIEDHRAELASVVLEVHLEHAALDYGETDDGGIEPLDMPTPKWWFVSRKPALEATVKEALETEGVRRSMILAPNAFGEQPPTDGAFYHTEGVPIVHHLAAPWYLFDELDQPDKIDEEGLVPLTRAAIRIIQSTGGIDAATMRQA